MVRLSALLVVCGLAACSSAATVPSAEPSLAPASVPSSEMAEPSTLASASSTALGDPVPPELLGTWEAEIVPRVGGFAPTATLRFTENGFHLVRDPDIASGTVTANGDVLEFSAGSVCQVAGTYRWSLSGGNLTFTEVSDSCSGRLSMLDGQVYTNR
jgi:hypothetical protein